MAATAPPTRANMKRTSGTGALWLRRRKCWSIGSRSRVLTPGTGDRLWRWGRVELPVQGLRADRVYERSRRFFVSRNEARTDTLLVLARSVFLSPPTDRSAGRSSAYIALPGPRSGDREDVSLTRQRERKKCWQLSACRSD